MISVSQSAPARYLHSVGVQAQPHEFTQSFKPYEQAASKPCDQHQTGKLQRPTAQDGTRRLGAVARLHEGFGENSGRAPLRHGPWLLRNTLFSLLFLGHRFRVLRRDDSRGGLLDVHVGELGAKEQNDRGVVNPHHNEDD